MKIDASKSIVKVGDGRGFVVEYQQEWPLEAPKQFTTERVVITAAHCLPQIPQGVFDDDGKLYKNLLGLLDDRKLGVWAECMFVDPVSDIAILCAPHSPDLMKQNESFLELMNEAQPVRISRFQSWWGSPALVLSLKGEWLSVKVTYEPGYGLRISYTSQVWLPGMSGSPIVSNDGTAIGLISGAEDGGSGVYNPLLAHRLPAWLASAAILEPVGGEF